MDPTANLEEQLRITKRLQDFEDSYGPAAPEETDNAIQDGARLAELVEALNTWIRRGGFLPGPWQR